MKAILFLALALIANSAVAGDPEWQSGNPVANCDWQTYNVSLRTRPLAMVNETTRGAYINCALRSDVKDGVIEFGAMIQSYITADVTVPCTGVIGNDDGDADYITKSVDVPAGTRRYIRWRDNDAFEGNVSFQCYLPAGLGLNELPLLR
jgi:hypothetical protein